MKVKKSLKISFIGLTSAIAIATPIIVSYKINELKPSAQFVPKSKPQALIYKGQKKSKKYTSIDIINGITKGEINPVNLEVDDFMVFVEEIKSPQFSAFKLLVQSMAPQLLAKINEIDNNDIRWFLDVILNKGIATLSRKDIPRLQKLATLIPNPNKKDKDALNKKLLLELIDYIPIALSEGVKQVMVEKNNAFFEKKAPQLANLIIAQIDQKANLKPNDKTEIVEKLVSLLRKILITGYKSQNVNGKLKTASEIIANDLSSFIYLLSDKGVIEVERVKIYDREPIGRFSVSVESIIKKTILKFINFLQTPTIEFSDQKIKALEKTIASEQKKVDSYNKKINNKKIQRSKNRLNNEMAANEFQNLKTQVTNFVENKYNKLMFQVDIDNDALADINKFEDESTHYYKARWYDKEPNHLLKTKWYKNHEKALWVLARSLWNLYPGQNKTHNTKEMWYQKLENDWKYGVTSAPTFFNGGGPAALPDSDKLKETVKKAYGEKIAANLEARWNKINDNEAQRIISENEGKKIAKPLFSKEKFNLMIELIDLDVVITSLQESRKTNSNAIKDFRSKIKIIKNSHSYQYELKHKVTKKELASNQFFNGKGLIKLAQKDLTNLLYKLQDVFLNSDYYLDSFLDDIISETANQTLDNWENEKNLSLFEKLRRNLIVLGAKATIWLLSDDIKEKIKKEEINPIMNKYITKELKDKVKFLNPIRVAKAISDISNKGIGKVPNNSLIYLAFIVKKFVDIKISNQDLLKVVLAIKHGFHSLSTSSRIGLVSSLLDMTSLSPLTKNLIKKYINPSSKNF